MAAKARPRRQVRSRIAAGALSVLAFLGIGAAIGVRGTSSSSASAAQQDPSFLQVPDEDQQTFPALPGVPQPGSVLPPTTSTQGS